MYRSIALLTLVDFVMLLLLHHLHGMQGRKQPIFFK